MIKRHYVYKLSNKENTLHYVGVRSCECDPIDDIRYMGSSDLMDWVLSLGVHFDKTIISEYETRDIANIAEQSYFDTNNCAESLEYINLHSFNNPYVFGRAGEKFSHINLMYADIKPSSKPTTDVDRFGKISADDMLYRVHSYPSEWRFINHPDRLRAYYPTTGTQIYSPGRIDNLMNIKNGISKYYSTNMSGIDGTPLERIEILLNEHYVPGQHFLVLDMINQLKKLLLKPELKIIDKILNKKKNLPYQIKQHTHIFTQ